MIKWIKDFVKKMNTDWEREFDLVLIKYETLIKHTEELLQQKEEGEALLLHIAHHLAPEKEVTCTICKITSAQMWEEWKSKGF